MFRYEAQHFECRLSSAYQTSLPEPLSVALEGLKGSLIEKPN